MSVSCDIIGAFGESAVIQSTVRANQSFNRQGTNFTNLRQANVPKAKASQMQAAPF